MLKLSGPKISQYELEKQRREELERIQKEMLKLKKEINDISFDVENAKVSNKYELIRLKKLYNLVNDTKTLSFEEKSVTLEIINSVIEKTDNLLELLSYIAFNDLGETLDAIRENYNKISLEYNNCKSIIEDIEQNMLSIKDSISKVSMEQNDKYHSEVFDINVFISQQSHSNNLSLDKLKENITSKAEKLIRTAFIPEELKNRLENVIRNLEQISEPKRLHDIESQVVDEIGRILIQYKDYLSLKSTENNMLETLGKELFDDTITHYSVSSIKSKTEEISERITELEKEIIEREERKEISRSIDMAMEELGYKLCGQKAGSKSKQPIKVYRFGEHSGIQMIQNDDGQIQLKVIGFSLDTQHISLYGTAFLINEQKEFCNIYDTIIEKFKEKGVYQVGKETRNPVNIQFNQFVNPLEYGISTNIENNNPKETKENTAIKKKKYQVRFLGDS